MVADKFVHVEPDSEVGRFILQTIEQPIVTTINGLNFRITRDLTKDISAYYNAERTLEALRGLKGIFTHEEAEALKRQIRIDRGHDDEG